MSAFQTTITSSPAPSFATPALPVRLLACAKAHFLAFFAAVAEVVTENRENESEIRKLYRLSAGSESVTAPVLAMLRTRD